MVSAQGYSEISPAHVNQFSQLQDGKDFQAAIENAEPFQGPLQSYIA